MSTFILEVQFIDAINSIDKEFDSLDAVLTYLNGQRETDFDWLSLHDNNTDMVIEGWSDIHQYINENTGVSKSSCIALRAAELGLPCIDLSTMTKDEYEAIPAPIRNRSVVVGKFKPEPLRASQFQPGTLAYLNLNKSGEVAVLERFEDLPDGALFYLAETYAYGGRKLYQKVLEDGGEHNAVMPNIMAIAIKVPNKQLVIRAK